MTYHVARFDSYSPSKLQEYLNKEEEDGYLMSDFHDDGGWMTLITRRPNNESKTS